MTTKKPKPKAKPKTVKAKVVAVAKNAAEDTERSALVASLTKGCAVEWKGSPEVAKPGTLMLVEAPKTVNGVEYVRVRWGTRRDVVVSPHNIIGAKISKADLAKMREQLKLRMPAPADAR